MFGIWSLFILVHFLPHGIVHTKMNTAVTLLLSIVHPKCYILIAIIRALMPSVIMLSVMMLSVVAPCVAIREIRRLIHNTSFSS